jgi:hypothetical protein
VLSEIKGKTKTKAIPTAGRADPQGREVSKLPHFLENRPADGAETVDNTPPPPPGRFLILTSDGG